VKVAVTSLGESIESPVDQRFGRTRYFVLVDTETEAWKVHNNAQNLEAAQGAGIQAAQSVIELGAEAVVTGHCGPKAFATLAAGNVCVYQDAKGTVREAMAALRDGGLKQAHNPDVGAGFGSV